MSEVPTIQSYDNGKVYLANDKIRTTEGRVYKFKETIGAAGYGILSHPNQWIEITNIPLVICLEQKAMLTEFNPILSMYVDDLNEYLDSLKETLVLYNELVGINDDVSVGEIGSVVGRSEQDQPNQSYLQMCNTVTQRQQTAKQNSIDAITELHNEITNMKIHVATAMKKAITMEKILPRRQKMNATGGGVCKTKKAKKTKRSKKTKSGR